MKKRSLTLFFVCVAFCCSIAQTAEYGINLDHLQQQNNYQVSGGFVLHAPIKDDICLNYRLGFGYKTGGGIYIHTDAGILFGIVIISTVQPDFKAAGWLSVLSILIPEGVGYYPDKNHNLYLAVNPLDVDYWHRKNPYQEKARMCGTLEASYKLPQARGIPGRITPYVAFNMMYMPADEFQRFGLRAGVAWLFSDAAKEKTKQYNYEQ